MPLSILNSCVTSSFAVRFVCLGDRRTSLAPLDRAPLGLRDLVRERGTQGTVRDMRGPPRGPSCPFVLKFLCKRLADPNARDAANIATCRPGAPWVGRTPAPGGTQCSHPDPVHPVTTALPWGCLPASGSVSFLHMGAPTHRLPPGKGLASSTVDSALPILR